MCVFFVVFLLVFQKSSSFCRENEIFENKKRKKEKKLDQFLTYKKGNLGPAFNSTAYIYIYAVRLLSGPSLGVFGSYYLVQVGFLEVIIWSKFVFLAYKNSGFKRLVLHTQLSFCAFFLSPIFWQFSENSLFQKKGAKIGFSNFQCFKFKFSKLSFFRFAKTL